MIPLNIRTIWVGTTYHPPLLRRNHSIFLCSEKRYRSSQDLIQLESRTSSAMGRATQWRHWGMWGDLTDLDRATFQMVLARTMMGTTTPTILSMLYMQEHIQSWAMGKCSLQEKLVQAHPLLLRAFQPLQGRLWWSSRAFHTFRRKTSCLQQPQEKRRNSLPMTAGELLTMTRLLEVLLHWMQGLLRSRNFIQGCMTKCLISMAMSISGQNLHLIGLGVMTFMEIFPSTQVVKLFSTLS